MRCRADTVFHLISRRIRAFGTTYSPVFSWPACIILGMLQYVLIIEIDTIFRTALTQVFRGEGIEVIAEADSGGGVARIMQRVPGVVLMAEDMPSLDGVELLPLARRLTSSPIIVVGDGGDTAVVKALLQGADMYLRKPVNYVELLSRINALARRSEPDPYGRVSEMSFARCLGRLAEALMRATGALTPPATNAKASAALTLRALGAALYSAH